MPTEAFTPSFRLAPLSAALALLLVSSQVRANTFQVFNESQLEAAIHRVNATPGPHFIEIRDNIKLSGALPPVLNTVVIKGANHTLEGSGKDRVFLVGSSQDAGGPRVLVQINDLSIIRGVANGGEGRDGGGGGLGAGGGGLRQRPRRRDPK